ncbi:MAG: hypothetical protein ACI8TL_000490 [Natronomonas sp.]
MFSRSQQIFASSPVVTGMGDFDGLDLHSVEDQLTEGSESDGSGRIVLGVLDGTTPGEEWVNLVDDGAVLVLNVDGDLNELGSEFAREVSEAGGNLVHFRGFLIVTPPGVTIDTGRLD